MFDLIVFLAVYYGCAGFGALNLVLKRQIFLIVRQMLFHQTFLANPLIINIYLFRGSLNKEPVLFCFKVVDLRDATRHFLAPVAHRGAEIEHFC